ncbi:sterol desaturase/sphingolipid hydroxylase (fatty acid hydroxylase superfamily) [Bradyrhizobium japonicum]|uniref:Sterol desaturase/sphingolipid hydroxylase (Fatty acid hydroxylase superfamily) n=1 Tax=Bradyrhizobium elkanii TaxID=29448 RepID=A0ABV4ERC5_BRAEL|nr:sterol desaturase family protein [Bradyrhizobium elkanii]MBP2429865.1 sterol desaturase/sphingolipid hydroxylase (fatty acid hydroxylase superfamily) [Bradyrhizobium elkanii]MCP1736665.1 sterol desaturase/sphingolipid hydroxylase (fatty acid hydroxylase superfamily) [Bradyrhizobium elkanii]MCP1754710.1 sterol desaturase/sphingolipid hydroxylase (fatty acid hydroxylase superfamily) [Bradyrhizobium elkanii]MCP1980226.1 sterol desaturase/sphingolipid hydroxylase (fatty acid hydroxylase superfam
MIGFAKLLWHPGTAETAHIELPSTGARIAFLLASFAIVLLFEAAFPLFSCGRSDRLRNIGRNAAITVIFVGVNLLLSPLSPLAAQWTLDAKFGLSWWLGLSPPSQLLLGIVGLDLFAYFAHVSMHKLGWMWRFHRMHHADRFVDVTTAFREHPGETLWRIGWHIAGVLVFGTPAWVLVSYLTLSALNAQFEHANIRLPERLDRWLRLVFVTPNMHKMHHSRHQPETDANYSNLLSIWDRLGGTYHRGPRFAELRYGLDGFDDPEKQSLRGLLKMPFMRDWGRPGAGPDDKADRSAPPPMLPWP